MSTTEQPRDQIARRASYFFLSYAHSAPLAGDRRGDPDQWVGRFFDDLSAAVGRHSAPDSRLAPGFYDQDIPLNSDRKAALAQALNAAEVLVPLYSPGYFARSWPGREWESFRQRIAGTGLGDPERRIVPVLWIPVLADQVPEGLAVALAIGGSESAYAENGMRALLRLSPYRASYQLVLDRLAARIVRLAETEPLPPSTGPDIDEVISPFKPSATTAFFSITVAAPALANLAADRDPAGYGSRSVDWRPYPRQQEQAVADYAAWVAEQLDFAVMIGGIEPAADGGDAAVPRQMPGVVLVDPWLLADQEGDRILTSLVGDLPSWVLPLLVLDPADGERTRQLAERARAIIGPAAARTEPARRAVKGVTSLQDFVSLVPVLVAEAKRQYLRHGPVARPARRPDSKPVLGSATRQISAPKHSSEEQPDA